MTTPTHDDTAALVAAARAYAGKARRVMSEINAEPPLYVAYLDRLAAALEAAQAREGRLRTACKHAEELLGTVYEGAQYWYGEQPDEQHILHLTNDTLHLIDKTRKYARAALGDTP